MCPWAAQGPLVLQDAASAGQRVLTRSDAQGACPGALECLSCSRPTELWAGEIAQECAPYNLLFSVQLELLNGT